jgi:hypothetical protein
MSRAECYPPPSLRPAHAHPAPTKDNFFSITSGGDWTGEDWLDWLRDTERERNDIPHNPFTVTDEEKL